MNTYEILFILIGIWLTLLTIVAYVIADMLDRTNKLKDNLTKLYSYVNVDLDPEIKRIRTFVIDELRSKQEPKTGYWIEIDGDNAICGCCKRINLLYGSYCKHCGAEMMER